LRLLINIILVHQSINLIEPASWGLVTQLEGYFCASWGLATHLENYFCASWGLATHLESHF